MTATLRKKAWLLREWSVVTPAGEQTVVYSGRRHVFDGQERIEVNGVVAAKARNWGLGTTKVEFKIGDLPATVDVGIWPWCALQSIRLQIAGVECYREGNSKARFLRASALGAFLLVLYLGSYAVLSGTGGWVVTESGETRPFRLAMADSFTWQPRYGQCERFRQVDGSFRLRANELGYFYAPLILLDQRYVHPTIRFTSMEGDLITPLPAPPLAQYHPLRASRWHGRFPWEQPISE